MDISALSSSVRTISTVQQQLQDNRINTQKVDADGCEALQPYQTQTHATEIGWLFSP